MTSPVANLPLNSVYGIEALVAFGVQIFAQIYTLFAHPTNPVPPSAAPVLAAQLQATPGLTEEHKAVIANMAQAAATAVANK